MTLALFCPQHYKQLQQVSLGSVRALYLHPSVFISVSFYFVWRIRPVPVPVSGTHLILLWDL